MSITDQIKQQVQIQELVFRMGFEINKQGFIRSPFNDNDKHASCKIYMHTNSFFDYSTDTGGSVIDLYQKYYNLDLSTAIKELAKIGGIEPGQVEREAPKIETANNAEFAFLDGLSEDEQYIFYERFGISDNINEGKKDLFNYRLGTNKAIFEEMYKYCTNKPNDAAMLYLRDRRKLTSEALRQFKIFTIGNYNELNNHLKKRFSSYSLLKSGLYNDKGNLIFFNHRICIPYLQNDSIVYLRGRYFDQKDNTSSENGFKYLGIKNDSLNINSPKRFFNEDVVSKMFPGERLYIVEGEFDAMALTSIGCHALAIPGVGNMPEIKRFMKLLPFEVVVVPDQDAPGAGLSDRLVDLFHSLNKEIIIKTLTSGKDVNDFVVDNKK